jgi:hypothetical protein
MLKSGKMSIVGFATRQADIRANNALHGIIGRKAAEIHRPATM